MILSHVFDCARCVDVCPIFLLPNTIGTLSEAGRFPETEGLGVMNCIECGGCTYICPAKRNLMQWISLAKSEVRASHIQKKAG